MTSQTRQRVAPANRPRLLWSSLVLLAAAVVLSVISLLALGTGSGATLRSLASLDTRVVRAAALDEKTVVAGTVDNHLRSWQDGQMAAEQQVPFLVNAMTSLPGDKVAVGLVTGEIQVFDRQLQQSLDLKVKGRITGLAGRPDGGFVVTYGSGASAHDFRVEQYDAAGKLQITGEVGSPTKGVATAGDLILYCNTRGEVGAVDSSGKVVWHTLTKQGLNVIAASDASAIFVGDVRGGVNRIAADGSVTWYQTLTEYEIVALYALPDGAGVIAGAKDGSVFALDGAGMLQFSQRALDAPIAALVVGREGEVNAVATNGSQVAVNVSSLESSGSAGRLRLFGYGAVIVLFAAAVTTGVLGFGRSRIAAKRTTRRINQGRMAYILIAPSMILMAVFTYYPALMAFYLAFTNFSLSKPLEFVGFRNFVLMASDPFLIAGIKNMLILLVSNVVKTLTLPLLVAELIFWIKSDRIKYWFRTAFVVPAIVPGIVAILLWKTIWAPRIGLVNQVLAVLGLERFQHAWLGEEGTALLTIIMTGFPWIDIFAFLVFFGGLLAISTDLFDAASVDGANWVRRFWSLDLPALRPQIMILLFFTFIGSIQGFAGIFVLTGGGPGTATYVPALEMYFMISRTAEFGYASAIGFVLAIVVGVLVLLRLRLDPQQEA